MLFLACTAPAPSSAYSVLLGVSQAPPQPSALAPPHHFAGICLPEQS